MPTDDERRDVARSCNNCTYRLVCSAKSSPYIAEYCSTYQHRIDRNSLLALADEMEEVAQSRWEAGHKGIAINDANRAARIREALWEGA